MNTIKELTKPFYGVVTIVMVIITIVTYKNILASEWSLDSESKKTPKYSQFFNEKKHWCEALIITCSDFRFTAATQEFINDRLGLKNDYDYISIPGAIRNLLDKNTRDLVLNKFGISFSLHHVKRVFILGHQDCSTGYGGSKNFTGSEVEYETICKDLRKARRLMRFKFPHLKVYLYYGTVFFNEHQRVYNFRQIL